MADLPRLLVDANVFFNNAQRNLFMTLAIRRVVDLRWTDEIEAEWVRNLGREFQKRGDDPAKAARTASLMRKAWPNYAPGDIRPFLEHTGSTDKKDQHVAAAALAVRPSILITHNLRDFDSLTLMAQHVVVESPDRGLLLISAIDPEGLISATKHSKKFIYNNDLSWPAYIAHLARNDLPGFGDWLRRQTIDDDIVSALTDLVEDSSATSETDVETGQAKKDDVSGPEANEDVPPTNRPKF
jgi:hypothetical protein